MAGRIRKVEMTGLGCFLQALGLLFFLGFPIGMGPVIIGVGFFILGSAKATYWTCGDCGNRLTDEDASLCSVCGETIKYERGFRNWWKNAVNWWQ